MNIKKVRKIMLRDKILEVLQYKITEEYLTERVISGEKNRKETLTSVQNAIQEAEKQVEFLNR